MSDDELVGRAVAAMTRKMIETGSSFGSSREAIEILARAAIAEVQRWRPIAEAPKDGVSFLAASGEWQTVCCWNKYRNDWCAVAPSYPSYVADERPIHWQPLPAPPQ